MPRTSYLATICGNALRRRFSSCGGDPAMRRLRLRSAITVTGLGASSMATLVGLLALTVTARTASSTCWQQPQQAAEATDRQTTGQTADVADFLDRMRAFGRQGLFGRGAVDRHVRNAAGQIVELKLEKVEFRPGMRS